MRVLMTTDTVGGVWTFTSELSEELLRQGHSIALLSFGPLPNDSQSKWATTQHTMYPERFQHRVSTAPLEWSQENARTMMEGEPALLKIAEGFEPDVLLSSQFCFGATAIGVPCVIVVHSDVLSWARACNPAACTPTPWIDEYKRLVQDGLSAAQVLVAPTKAALDDLASGFVLPELSVVIPNGRVPPPAERLPDRQWQAVSAGRLWDLAKGLDVLCTCELPLPVFLAGTTQFEGSAELCTLPDNVHVLGNLSSEQLYELFRRSAVYLCTSRYEPFGLAPLEAALCGCAIVAHDLSSLREVWGDDALYFHDAFELAGQIELLKDNDALRSEMGERAQRKAMTYTVKKMADRYLKQFAAVLARGDEVHVA